MVRCDGNERKLSATNQRDVSFKWRLQKHLGRADRADISVPLLSRALPKSMDPPTTPSTRRRASKCHGPRMPRGSKGPKFYGVACGREPGVYTTWDEASRQVTGMKGAVHKSFSSFDEAAAWVQANSVGGVQAGASSSRPEPTPRSVAMSPPTSPNPRRTQASPRPSNAARGMSTVASDAHDDSDISRAENPTTSSPQKLPPGKYSMYFDGACRGNPGPSGAGALLKKEVYGKTAGETVFELAVYLGDDLTNNESEYFSLISGLRKAKELGVTELKVYGDSKLVVNQVNGTWQVKKEHLQPLWQQAREIIQTAPFRDRFSLHHVEREFNSEADALANAAITVGQTKGKGVNVAEGLLTLGIGGLHGADANCDREDREIPDAANEGSAGDGTGKQSQGGGGTSTFTTLGGFASSKIAQFARPVFPRPMSVSPSGKRPFPSVGTSVPEQSRGKHARVDTTRAAAGEDSMGKESEKNNTSPDPSAMFASLTVSRMRRHSNAARFAPNVLRVARFFV